MVKKNYKSSFYNHFFKVGDNAFVYNMLSTALLQLTDCVIEALKLGNIESIDHETFLGLLQEGVIVPHDMDEKQNYLYFYNRIRFGGSAKLLSITFLPTYGCNLACPYCLEGQNKSTKMISMEDVDKILMFAENTIQESRMHGVPIEQINAKMYGGEPMMHKKAMMYYFDKMNEIAEKYGCVIHNMMTSNFTLLDDDILEMIKKYHVIVQVTIDGTKEEHDKRRITHGGSGTYDVIINNLERMKNEGLEEDVVIRINIDKDNVDRAEEAMQNVCKYSPDVYFGLLEEFNGLNDNASENFISSKNGDEKITSIQKLNNLMRKYGYIVAEEFGKIAPCGMNIENKFYIDPYLNVYKCELLVNNPEVSVGVIDDNGNFMPNANFYKQMNHSPEKQQECMECQLLPMCASGCIAKEYIARGKKDGDLNLHYCMCNFKYLDAYLTGYVKRLMAENNA